MAEKMGDEHRGARERSTEDQAESSGGGISDGLKQGLGVLSALKDALEETIHDAKERGDLSTERAKEVLHGAMTKAKEAAGEAKDKLDVATQRELDTLRAKVDDLRVRMDKADTGGRSGGSESAGNNDAKEE